MANQDRLYVDKNKVEFVRNLSKNNEYLAFDNLKDLFIYAMSLGVDCPTSFVGNKEGLFLEKDMNYEFDDIFNYMYEDMPADLRMQKKEYERFLNRQSN